MLRITRFVTGSLMLLLASAALAQGFVGTFQETQSGLLITFNEAQQGALTPTGPQRSVPAGRDQRQLRFRCGLLAAGAARLQAQLSPDGTFMQSPSSRQAPTARPSAGPTMTMQRQAAGGCPPSSRARCLGRCRVRCLVRRPDRFQVGWRVACPARFRSGAWASSGSSARSGPGYAWSGSRSDAGPSSGSAGYAGYAWSSAGSGAGADARHDRRRLERRVCGRQRRSGAGGAGFAGQLRGYIQLQGQQYQFQAHLDDLTLHGYFMAGAGSTSSGRTVKARPSTYSGRHHLRDAAAAVTRQRRPR